LGLFIWSMDFLNIVILSYVFYLIDWYFGLNDLMLSLFTWSIDFLNINYKILSLFAWSTDFFRYNDWMLSLFTWSIDFLVIMIWCLVLYLIDGLFGYYDLMFRQFSFIPDRWTFWTVLWAGFGPTSRPGARRRCGWCPGRSRCTCTHTWLQ